MQRLLTIFVIGLSISIGHCNDSQEKFEFTRIEPGNELGITTKVIAHIHRPAKKTTETWTLNREFTPDIVVETLNATCSEKFIVCTRSNSTISYIIKDRRLKWRNCKLDNEGFTAELTHGRPETKNKTFVYLAMSHEPVELIKHGKRMTCSLAIVDENPAYFLLETFSKIPSNDSFPKTHKQSVDAVHVHMLGKFGKEFLGVYGDSIDQDAIYNFDVMDYTFRDELYECFLSIGSSESVAVLEEKCPIYCMEEVDSSELHEELENVNSDRNIYMIKRTTMDGQGEEDETMEEILEDGEPIGHTMYIHNEL